MADKQDIKEKLKKEPLGKRIRYFLEYLGFLLLKILFGKLPKRCAFAVAKLLGKLAYYADGRHRRMAIQNIAAAFPGEKTVEEVKQIAKNNFIHIAQTGVDVVRGLSITKENYADYFTFEGDDIYYREIKKAKENKKGVIAISAHLGSQEMLVAHVLRHGEGAESIVTKRIKNPYLDKYIQSWREKMGVKVLPHRGSAKEIIKRITNGEIIVFLLDQRASYYEGVTVNFFGQPAMAHKAIAQLALVFDLQVVPIFAIKQPDGKYCLSYHEPLKLIRTGDMEKDTVANTQLFQDVIERMIRKYPEQWWWAHDRWKHVEPSKKRTKKAKRQSGVP